MRRPSTTRSRARQLLVAVFGVVFLLVAYGGRRMSSLRKQDLEALCKAGNEVNLSSFYSSACGRPRNPPPIILRCTSWEACLDAEADLELTTTSSSSAGQDGGGATTLLVREGSGKEDVGTTPLFIIIGAQKAGTTNLRHNLLSHPSLAGSRTETHFFDWHFPTAGEGGDAEGATDGIAEGGGAAAALRAYSRRLLQGRAGLVRAASDIRRVARGRAFVFDTSPSYYLIPAAAARAAALRPRARLVLLVRDPVERYFSAAHMVTCWNATVGLPTEAFHAPGGAAARAAEFAAAYNASDADGCMGLPLRGGRCQWGAFTGNALARGLYADALQRWLRAFPARNVLVVDSARYFRATQAVLDEVLAFLGLPPHVVANTTRHRSPVARCPPDKDALFAAYRRESEAAGDARALRAFYAPHNEELFRMLGRDLGWNDIVGDS